MEGMESTCLKVAKESCQLDELGFKLKDLGETVVKMAMFVPSHPTGE